jgi:hypothetical protein
MLNNINFICRWHNNGKGVHIVQSADGSFDSGIIRVGDSFTQYVNIYQTSF